MRRKAILFGVAGLCVTAMSLSGCGRSKTVVQADAPLYPEAVYVYQLGCDTCHGENLQGGIGPNLQHVGSRLTLRQIEHRIEAGAGPMPPYAAKNDAILTRAQIAAVARWLETKK